MDSVKRFESAVIDGAFFVLKRVGRQVRHRAERSLCEIRHQQRMATQEQLSILPEAIDPEGMKEQLEQRFKNLTKEDTNRLDYLGLLKELLLQEIRTGYVRVMLESFHIPGEEYITLTEVEALLEYGPEAFVEEVCKEADHLWGLTPADAKNSQSPSTSDGPVDGATKKNDGTAEAANSAETTALGIVA